MMKQPVRIQEFKDTKLGYGFCTIQILVPTSAGADTMEPVGYIQFQRTLSEGGDARWYGMTYKVDCTHPNTSHLRKMNRVADVIVKKCGYDLQPVDVLDAINAIRYKVFKNEFYPEFKAGENLYDVMKKGFLYSRVAAMDEKEASKILKKRKINDYELKFDSIIKF